MYSIVNTYMYYELITIVSLVTICYYTKFIQY